MFSFWGGSSKEARKVDFNMLVSLQKSSNLFAWNSMRIVFAPKSEIDWVAKPILCRLTPNELADTLSNIAIKEQYKMLVALLTLLGVPI